MAPVETDGAAYVKFETQGDCVKRMNGITEYWHLRSANSADNFYRVDKIGARISNTKASVERGIALGFCTN